MEAMEAEPRESEEEGKREEAADGTLWICDREREDPETSM